MKIILLLLGLATSSYAANIPGSDADFARSLNAVSAKGNAEWAAPLAIADVKARAIGNSELMGFLNDADSQVRLSALRLAREQVNSMSMCDKVISMAADTKEVKAVRLEAVKTLSFANFDKTNSALMTLAEKDEDSDIRAQACKSLYNSAASHNKIWEFLVQMAASEKNQQVRLAAIWGLFRCQNGDARKQLQTIALNPAEDTAVRVEAVRSLYNLRSAVVPDIENLTKDVNGAQDVRVAAIHLLAVSGRLSEVENFARHDQDPVVRSAAIEVLSFNQMDFETYFHLGHGNQQGQETLSPIDM